MKTKAQELGITEFPYIEHDTSGNKIYSEDSDGHWVKIEHDESGNKIYCEGSDGFWVKCGWVDGKCVYYEDYNGEVRDNR